MAAPPTPPPTTEAELMDDVIFSQPQQRTEPQSSTSTTTTQLAVPAPATTTATPTAAAATSHDSYVRNFPLIKELAEAKNVDGVVNAATDADLRGHDDSVPTRVLIIAPLVLGHLCQMDLPTARHTLTSLPKSLNATPLIRALLQLTSNTYQKKHSDVYKRAQDLQILVHKPEFPNPELAAVVSLLVDLFVDIFREKTVQLLASAFTNVPLAVAEKYLCLSSESVLDGAKSKGWSYDATAGMIYPIKPERV